LDFYLVGCVDGKVGKSRLYSPVSRPSTELMTPLIDKVVWFPIGGRAGLTD